MKAKAILTAILLLAAGIIARAEDGWSISQSTSGNVTTFTITRTNTAVAETVKYRLVNLSAYAGQHYNVTKVNGQNSNALSGEFTFAEGDNTSRTVQVTEIAASTDAYKYQTASSRSYKLEVTDIGGFSLAEGSRSFTTGTTVPTSNIFSEKTITIASSEFLNTDDGYETNAYKSVNAENYFNNAAPKAYMQHINAQLRMTLSLDAKEKYDGYQYVQILVDNTTTCDIRTKNDAGGDPGSEGTPSLSRYMAGFEIKSGSKDDSYKTYTFPVTSVGNSVKVDDPWGYGTNYPLDQQRFNTDCRASDGKLILPTSFSTLVVRFNASGSDDDDWYANNVNAKITAVDATAPTKLAISVAPGRHSRGNTVYVSVAFSEIVTSSSASLSSNWGSLSYVAGSGSNVLTFKRIIPESASGDLNITGFSGITDMAGNAPSSVTASNLCALDESYAYTITYNLDDGSVATANPTSYTYETATFTLNNPAKTTCYFNGWTGSNGDTPQTTVTIASHNHGNKSYTANWTPVWTGSGSEADPYTITSTLGLDLLAQYVNSGNNCSGLYFQLGGNITYTHTTDWNNSSSTENNYTAIGTDSNPFQGTFDGCNYTISGIRIYKGGAVSADGRQGLFGAVKSGGTVKRVNLYDTRITGKSYIAGISGENNGGTVEDCIVAADVCIHAVVTDAGYHGGITGHNSGTTTTQRCLSRAILTVVDATDCNNYGGITGYQSNSGKMFDCLVVGAVIPAVNNRGAISGSMTGGSGIKRNYYRDCTVAGVTNANDVGSGWRGSELGIGDLTTNQGALPLYAVTLPEHVSLVRTASATLPGSGNKTYTTGADIGGVPYAMASAAMSLSYDSAVPSGNVLSVSVKETSGGAAVALTDNGNNSYSFTMPAADVTVTANVLPEVSYIDAEGNLQSHVCTPIVSGTTSYGNPANDEGWYVVNSDVTISGTHGVKFLDKAVHIILCEGATLTSNATSSDYNGLTAENGSLAIYGQSLGAGKIVVTDINNTAIYAKGNLNLNGGIISGNTTNGTAGINTYGSLTIRRGSVTASGLTCGILVTNNLTILGGTVNATATNDTNGSGLYSALGNISILGGNVTTTGSGGGIKAGGFDATGTITLGWTKNSDSIYASSYACATLKIADGQTLTDGNSAHTYTGTLDADQKAAIAGKTLMKDLGPVSYIDGNGQEQTCTSYTIITSDTYSYGTGGVEAWYVVSGNVERYGFAFEGNTNLILCDGSHLNTTDMIYVYNSNLCIYAQSGGTGRLTVSFEESSGAIEVNDFTLYGGIVNATNTFSNNEGFGLRANGNVTINGGSLTATCTTAESGYGIFASNDVTINGGNVTANGSWTGIRSVDGNITLGWTKNSDSIYASSYGGATCIKDGQTLYDGDTPYSGTIDGTAIAGKTLAPYPGAGSGASAVTARKACLAGQERYWTTFYHLEKKYRLSAGAQAFIMKSDLALYRIGDGSIIPANCAVVIMADASALTNVSNGYGTLTISTTTADAPAVSGNILQGTSSAATVPGAYVLSKVSDNFGFYEYTGEIPANKAYYVEQ